MARAKRAKMILNPQKYVDSFARVYDEEPELAFRILLIRNILDQRSIDTNAIVDLTGYGKGWVLGALDFDSVRTSDFDGKRTYTVEAMHEKLDLIEEAITRWTSTRGGVYAVTGTTQQGAEEFKRLGSSEYQLARQEAGGRIV